MSDNEVRDETELDPIVAMAHRCYRESRDHSAKWRESAKSWYDLVANKQWDDADIEALEEQNRIPVVINRVARAVNAILGTQVSNRQETRFIPREEGDVQVNEILTGAGDWVRDGCDAEDEESDAFEDTTVCGMGWTETRLDYDTDPEGAVLIDRIDPMEMYWDPNAKKRNLADGRWFMRMKRIPLDEFEERWPDAGADLLSDPWEGPPDDLEARKHVYPQDAYNEQQGTAGKTHGKRHIRVAQIQWAEREPMYRVGQSAQRVSAKAFKKLKKKLDAEGVPYVKQTGVRWKQAFVAGGAVLEESESPYPEGPTFRCITYKRDRNKNTWYGVVAAMMDPQKYGNKFLSLIMDIVRSNSKGGVIMDKDAVDDPKEAEEKWARADGIIWTRPGAKDKIQPKPMPSLPAGLDRLVAYFLDSVHEVTGINLELLGMANREQAGVLENTRKQAGVTIIAPLFDGLRRYRKEQGRVLLYFIQTYLSDGRLIRVNGQNGQQYVPLSKEPDTARYDVIVDEAPTSPNMKERVFGSFIELAPHLLKANIPIPPSILKYSPFPSALTEEWQQMLEQSAGAPKPEEVQKIMQENQELRMKKDERMAELNMEAQKHQHQMQMEREKMQLEREKMAVEIEIARVKLQLEQEKAAAQLQLQQQQAQTEMALSEQKTNTELSLAQQKTQAELQRGDQELDLQRRKTEADVEAKLSSTGPGFEQAAERVLSKRKGKKRRVTLQRDPKGELVGAEIED